MTVTFDMLIRDAGLQPRAALDTALVEAYADAMRAGAVFPPIVVFRDEGNLNRLVEGFHRVAAAESLGWLDFPADIQEGDEADARWAASAANQTHGLRRTNEDKRRAVQLALQAHPNDSDRQIAEHVGVDGKTVGSVRDSLGCGSSAPDPDAEPTKRVGRDGKLYPVVPKPAGRSPGKAPCGPVAERNDPEPTPPALPDPKPPDMEGVAIIATQDHEAMAKRLLAIYDRTFLVALIVSLKLGLAARREDDRKVHDAH